MERTDIHRPSAIQPEDYEFVAFDFIKVETLGDCYVLKEQRDIKAAHFARTGGRYAQHEHGGSCMICGASASYTCTFYHTKTNEYIHTGHDCAQKLEMGCGDFNAFQRAITDAREAQAGKRKAKALLSDAGLSAAYDIYVADYDALPRDPKTARPERTVNEFGQTEVIPAYAGELFYEERTIRDIVGKFVKYGSINDAQMDLLRKLTERIPDRDRLNAERDAQRKAEKEAAAPCPKGRVKIEGIVVKTETKETAWGFREVMVVKASEGFVLWGSVPSGVTVAKDCKIVFVATIEPSENDPKFGFYKRPVLYMTKEEKAALKIAQQNIQLD